MPHPESFEQPKKIAEAELRQWADTILSGTMIRQMISGIKLKVDAEGNVEPFVIENLKKMSRVAARMTPEVVVQDKLRRFLTWLETGTDPGADRN